MLTRLDQGDREKLLSRAREWKGLLTEEQFMARNRRLYAHPYGRDRIRTFAWKVGGKLVASMDCLDVGMLAKSETGEIRETQGGLIASVVTELDARGKGHGMEMLKAFFAESSREGYVLYSDIGPAYYERLGFAPVSAVAVEHPAGAREAIPDGHPVTAAEFAQKLKESRFEELKKAAGPAVAICPDATLIDWHLERFRYFAEITGKTFPPSTLWQISGTHCLVAAVPDFVRKQLQILWLTGFRERGKVFARHLAKAWGIPTVRAWESRPVREGEKAEWPMARLGEIPSRFVDVQLGDWW